MRERVWVKWLTRDKVAQARIAQRFALPSYRTVNGMTPCEADNADMDLLRETARRGFISIIFAPWSKNGGTFSFTSR